MTPAPERPDLLDAAWAELLLDACASDGPIRDNDVRQAIIRNRPRIEAQAAAPVTDAGLDVERLAHAYNNVVVLTGTGKGWTMETWGEVAAEYAALSRQTETARVVTTRRADPIVISESDFGPVHGAEKE